MPLCNMAFRKRSDSLKMSILIITRNTCVWFGLYRRIFRLKVEAGSVVYKDMNSHSLQPSPKEGALKAGLDDHVFRYDSGRITPTRKDDATVFKYDSGNVTPTLKDTHFNFSPTTSRVEGHFKYDSTNVSPKLSPMSPQLQARYSNKLHITAINIYVYHRCQHKRFRAVNHAFRGPSCFFLHISH